MALLMFGPLAFGAVQPWAIFVLEAGAALLLALWIAGQALAGPMRIRTNALYWPMLAFAGVVAVQLAFHTTAYRLETVHHAQLYVAYAILLFLAVNVFEGEAVQRNLWVTLTGFGFLLAVFAMVQGFSSHGAIYWLVRPTESSWPYGPYVNHNHYAGLMEMLIPIPLVMSLRRNMEVSRRILLGFAAVVMGASLFLSQSRGGMLALLIELGVLVVVAARRNRAALIALGVFAIVCVGMLVSVGGGELGHRIASMQSPLDAQLSGSRITIARNSVELVKQKPLLGWGLGLFPSVYPSVRSFATDQFINEAHNDYVQLLVETGLLGFLSMIVFIVFVYRSALRGLRGWEFAQGRALTLAMMIGITGIVVHSLFDFNLQIPANAAMFFFCCGIAGRQPSSSPRKV
jgi:O-antigen ligase